MTILNPYQRVLGIQTESELVDLFCNNLVPTNRTYEFFVDWEKVRRNVGKFKTEIALLSSLAGSSDPSSDLRELLRRYPEVCRAIPILVAVRGLKFKVLEELHSQHLYVEYNFGKKKLSTSEIDSIVQFCTRTGIIPI